MTPGQVLDEKQSNLKGLNSSQVAERQARYGKNKLADPKRTPFIIRLLRQFNDPLVLILIGAAIISASISIYEGHPSDMADSGIIMLIVVLNAAIGLIQEGKAHTALEALKNMSKPFCNVVRDGVDQRIPSVELVEGDIVKLEAGDNVPADLRLIECASLSIVESALTGESVPVEKSPNTLSQEDLPLGDRINMAYSGSQVINGRAVGVVCEIGMNTQVGQIASMISEQPTQSTPLQKQLAKTAKWISLVVLGFAIIIFVAALVHKDPVVESFMTAVAIAVAAIPEGLPAVVTIVLAIGVRKMSQRNSIIRNIPAVEVLGRVQVICSDKTGTLTQNKMTVVELFTLADKQYSSEIKPASHAQSLLADALVFCNDTKIGDGELLGDPTETALIDYAQKHNLPVLNLEKKRVSEKPFDSDRKLMTVVMQTGNGRVAYTKGAMDNMLKLCTHIIDGNQTRAITSKDIEVINGINDKLSRQALRVLGVSIKTSDVERMEEGMTFVGLCGMIDPPRVEVTAAIATCKKAGIKPIMITGDHATTAQAIARQIGIEGKVHTGQQLDAMTDEQLSDIILDCGVFARVSPQNKVRIVSALKSKKIVVAMTGDGVNDAPSIKAADIGIGMGITGTDVSKGAADMILLDDNFATIVGAVEEGRRIFSNIKKAIKFLLSANIAEVASLFIISTILRQPFLTPIMILLVNLITDSLPALALGLERVEQDVMNYPPEKSDKSLFAGRMGVQIIFQGIIQTLLVMVTYIVAVYAYDSVTPTFELAMVFVTLISVQLFQAYNCKAERRSLFASNPFNNTFLNIGFIIGMTLVTCVIFVTPIRLFFKLPVLEFSEFMVAIAIAACIIPIVEIYKFVERRWFSK